MRKHQHPTVNEITEGVIWKQLLLFFFPIMLGTFFQQLYNTVDAIIVGQFVGKEALAAVGGATGTLINLLVGSLSACLRERRSSFRSITARGRWSSRAMPCIRRWRCR